MRDGIFKFWQANIVAPTAVTEDFFRWIPREHNEEADNLSKDGATVGNRIRERHVVHQASRFFRGYFDGSYNVDNLGLTGSGYVIEQAWEREGQDPVWRPCLKVCFRVSTQRFMGCAILSETMAAQQCCLAIMMAVENRHIDLTPACRVRRRVEERYFTVGDVS